MEWWIDKIMMMMMMIIIITTTLPFHLRADHLISSHLKSIIIIIIIIILWIYQPINHLQSPSSQLHMVVLQAESQYLSANHA